MMLVIPQLMARDLDDLNIVVRGGEEWAASAATCSGHWGRCRRSPARRDDRRHRPPRALPSGAAIAQRRHPASGHDPTTTGAWRLFDPGLHEPGPAAGERLSRLCRSGPVTGYVLLFGSPGQPVTVALP